MHRRILALAVAAFVVVIATVTYRSHPEPQPVPDQAPIEEQREPTIVEPRETDFATVTGPKVVYVVPPGTTRITARIKSPAGATLREFVITNWVTIRPGQHLELTTNSATNG